MADHRLSRILGRVKDIWRIIRFTSKLKKYYIGIAALTVLLAIISQLQPLLTKAAVDQITKLLAGGHANIKAVALFAFLYFVADVAQTIFTNVAGFIGDITSAKIQRIMSERYFAHLLSLPQRYFDTELGGKIINRMNRGISQIANYIQVLSNNFLQFIVSTVFTLIIVFHFSWQVGLMFLVIYPIFIYMTTRTSGKWREYQHKINEQQDIAVGRFSEAIGQVKVVKSYLQEEREHRLFSFHFGKMVETTYPQSKLWHGRDVWRRLALNVIFFGVFAYLFISTAQGAYTLGVMVLLMQYAVQIRIPIFSISFIVDQTQRAIANTKDYFEVMDQKPDIKDKEGAKPLAVSEGKIVFDNVTFGYDGQPVLKKLSFEVEADSKLALVGESGEGKTTITSLLLRLYDIDSGAIEIDGQSISDVTQESLRRAIAVVFQEPMLFSGTIRENIAYAKPAAGDDEIIAAAKAANAHEFIEKLEKGYDSEIGERGLKLSGGQKQRIAIARALLKDAPILILDEATSSLDSKSERMVQEALERLMKGRTTVIIAHRLSTIQNVDRIVTLRGGKVDEVGTPKQLAKSGGIYDQLLRLQDSHSESTKKRLQKYGLTAEE